MPEIQVIKVTPEIAKMWLERLHPLHRKPNQQSVDLLADEMMSGRWIFVPSNPIVFDVDGYLIDGEARLAAIIKANKDENFAVLNDAPNLPEVIDLTEKRKKRGQGK